MNLNKGQAEAIHHGEGPCMVVAPPGSGKTLIVTNRTKYLIEQRKVPAENILVITFTRYAAREMQLRFRAVTQGKNYPVTFGTFHSIFYGILKCAYGISSRNLLTEEQRVNLMREVTDRLEVEIPFNLEDEEDLLSEILREVSVFKNGLLPLSEYRSKCVNSDVFRSIFKRYEAIKKQANMMDFDDMMVQCYALFRERPDILANWQMKFRYILVDEFQDINRVQYEIIRMLAQPANNLFVVGDDDQSIYAFRGAKPELMQYMKQEYKNIRTIPLMLNYRSTEFIVNAASRSILHNENRLYKRVKASRGPGSNVEIQEVDDELEQGKYIAKEIQKRLDAGMKPEEIAILYRTAMQGGMISEQLRDACIEYDLREKLPNFYDHFIVKDMMAYMAIAQGYHDRAFFLRVANRPVRYLSRSSMDEREIEFEKLRITYSDKEWMQDIIDAFESDMIVMKGMTPFASIQFIRKKIGYDEFLRKYAAEKDVPFRLLEEVIHEFEMRCKDFKSYEALKKHIFDYSQELEDMKNQKQKAPGRGVRLMTIHASKGLEFDTVFIINANENSIPHSKSKQNDELEEERRLFYVAMTRAKDELLISYCSKLRGEKAEPSRFLGEIIGKTFR